MKAWRMLLLMWTNWTGVFSDCLLLSLRELRLETDSDHYCDDGFDYLCEPYVLFLIDGDPGYYPWGSIGWHRIYDNSEWEVKSLGQQDIYNRVQIFTPADPIDRYTWLWLFDLSSEQKYPSITVNFHVHDFDPLDSNDRLAEGYFTLTHDGEFKVGYPYYYVDHLDLKYLPGVWFKGYVKRFDDDLVCKGYVL